jgi:asparagine synthase (glutamine-hydrolysing)
MCGIAGLVWKTTAGKRIEDFRAAAAQLEHRGPDSSGEYLDEQILLIHYRLAILDLSPSGHQPYKLGEPPFGIGVYNGELYNYRALAESFNLSVTTACDTEVVFRSISKNGSDILRDYNGIFALAYYRPDSSELLLARDRFGVKPMYFVNTPDYFAFASEAKVLYTFAPTLTLNPRVLHEFLRFGSSMSMETIVTGVRKVAPGHYLRLGMSTGELEEAPYWSVEADLVPQSTPAGYNEAVVQTRQLLGDAVERQCLSDVPVGAYLSGGLDSSLVVALASQRTSKTLSTFSVRFEGSNDSELPLAREVADRYRTDHHEMEISTRGIESDIEGLILQYDEPFADPAALPLHLMAQKCAPIAKVILQGDGGDELFAGYGRHLDLSQRRRRIALFALLAHAHPKKSARQRFADRFHDLAAQPRHNRFGELTRSSKGLRLEQVLSGELRARALAESPLSVFEQGAEVVRDLDPVRQMLLIDMVAILPHTFLEKVDKVNMWHSVEARVPMLDNELVDYVSGLPSDYKIKGGRTKRLLRDVAKGVIPQSVLQGRKQSFGTPIDTWLRTILADYARAVFEQSRGGWEGYFDFDYIVALHDEHIAGRANHSGILWRLVVLLVWLNHYADKIDGIGGGPPEDCVRLAY